MNETKSPSQPLMTRVQESGLTFPQAIEAVIAGQRVTKHEWKNPDIYLAELEGFLKIHKADGTEHALLVNDGDLHGTDWYVLPVH